MPSSKAHSFPAPSTFQTPEDELAYYKSQYEHLANELEEFQETSRELEAELEKDAEAAEKREEKSRVTIESLRFEVNEWKAKHNQCKSEANVAQNNLQKEITTLRDLNRSTQLKLRDLEVANDDYERQARNTTSSIDDLESKYDTILERNIILEEEIRLGEQERETLRIETQRLRDELTDLKIEADITKNKLHTLELHSIEKIHLHASQSTNGLNGYGSISKPSGHSIRSSSPSAQSTPAAPTSESSTYDFKIDTPTSISTFDTSATARISNGPRSVVQQTANGRVSGDIAHAISKQGDPAVPDAKTPRARLAGRPPTFSRPTALHSTRPNGGVKDGLPRSGSLYQMRGLMGKMQKLEERVQSVRSKLPATAAISPATSRGATDETTNTDPETVTMRGASRRPSEFASTSETSAHSLPGRRESIRPSRTSLSGESNIGSDRLRSRASLASHAEALQASASISEAHLVNGSTPQSKIVASHVLSSSDGGGHYSGPRLANHEAVADLATDTTRTSPGRTTLDHRAVSQGLKTTTLPLKDRQSLNRVRPSVSGAVAASRRTTTVQEDDPTPAP